MRLHPALLATVLALVPALPFAQGLGQQVRPGEWVDVDGARARLVLGAASMDGRVEGAVEIDLEEGWKTYWIAPGPSGIPPTFDAEGSRNLIMEAVEFPPPHSFEDIYGKSVGYKDDVASPVAFRLLDPAAPARVSLTGFFGVCDEICVPVQLSVEGDVVTGMSTPFADGQSLRAARDALPERGASDELRATLVDGALLVSGPAIADVTTELFVAPTGTAILGEPSRVEDGLRFDVLRGEAPRSVVAIARANGRAMRYEITVD